MKLLLFMILLTAKDENHGCTVRIFHAGHVMFNIACPSHHKSTLEYHTQGRRNRPHCIIEDYSLDQQVIGIFVTTPAMEGSRILRYSGWACSIPFQAVDSGRTRVDR